jgi:hypothetical protein
MSMKRTERESERVWPYLQTTVTPLLAAGVGGRRLARPIACPPFEL